MSLHYNGFSLILIDFPNMKNYNANSWKHPCIEQCYQETHNTICYKKNQYRRILDKSIQKNYVKKYVNAF